MKQTDTHTHMHARMHTHAHTSLMCNLRLNTFSGCLGLHFSYDLLHHGHGGEWRGEEGMGGERGGKGTSVGGMMRQH